MDQNFLIFELINLSPKALIDSGQSIAWKSHKLTIVYYKHDYDNNGNLDGVIKSDIDDEENQFYLLIGKDGLSVIVLNQDGGQFPRVNAVQPIISHDNKGELLIEAVFYGMPYHVAIIKLEFNEAPIHSLNLNNSFAIISILGEGVFSTNRPSPQAQYILKDIEYIGSVETKIDY